VAALRVAGYGGWETGRRGGCCGRFRCLGDRQAGRRGPQEADALVLGTEQERALGQAATAAVAATAAHLLDNPLLTEGPDSGPSHRGP
jgi:hypothetical protein